MATLDVTDHNMWHFMNELMLPTFHALLNLDMVPAHVKRRVVAHDLEMLCTHQHLAVIAGSATVHATCHVESCTMVVLCKPIPREICP